MSLKGIYWETLRTLISITSLHAWTDTQKELRAYGCDLGHINFCWSTTLVKNSTAWLGSIMRLLRPEPQCCQNGQNTLPLNAIIKWNQTITYLIFSCFLYTNIVSFISIGWMKVEYKEKRTSHVSYYLNKKCFPCLVATSLGMKN